MPTIHVTAKDLQYIIGRTNESASLITDSDIQELVEANRGLEQLLKNLRCELCTLIDRAQIEAAQRGCSLDQIKIVGIGLVDEVTAEVFTHPGYGPWIGNDNIEYVRAHLRRSSLGQQFRLKEIIFVGELRIKFQRRRRKKPTTQNHQLATSTT